MSRQVRQHIKDDIDLIDTAFPNPVIKTEVIRRYLQNESVMEDV